MGSYGKYATNRHTTIKEQMQKKLLLIFIIMATWMVVSCTTTSQGNGCYGFWEDNRMGMKRGTIVGKNADYKKPYRQCVDEDNIILNKEKRPYG